jgi:hypothetical protein
MSFYFNTYDGYFAIADVKNDMYIPALDYFFYLYLLILKNQFL